MGCAYGLRIWEMTVSIRSSPISPMSGQHDGGGYCGGGVGGGMGGMT